MDFGKFDVVILITMSIAIICLTFTLPALGLTEADQDENDIPEFDMDSDRFDIVDDFPESPGQPSQGTLTRIENDSANDSRGQWLFNAEDISDSADLVLFRDGTLEDPEARVVLTRWQDGNDTTENATLSGVGAVETIENDDTEVEVTWTHAGNIGQSDLTIEVEYEIITQPDDESWYDSIPGISGIIGAGESLAGIIGWIGSIIFWGIGTTFEITANSIGMLFDAVSYGFTMSSWIINGYGDVVSSATSWAGIFVAIPGILLFLVFMKLVFIGVSLLPTT